MSDKQIFTVFLTDNQVQKAVDDQTDECFQSQKV